MNLLEHDRIDMFLENLDDGNVVDLSELDWNSIAGYFKDVPVVGDFAKDYRLGYSVAEKGPIAVTLLIAAMTALAFKVYKKHFSKAAVSCKQHKGQTRKSCIKAYKDQAIKLEIQSYQKMMQKCKLTKNPEKCVKSAKKKIDRLQARLTTGNVSENEIVRDFVAEYIDMHEIDSQDKKRMLEYIADCGELELEHFLFTGGEMNPESMTEGPIDWQNISKIGDTPPSKIEAITQMRDLLKSAKEIVKTQGAEMAEAAYTKMLVMIAKAGDFAQKYGGKLIDPSAATKAGLEHGAKTGGLVLGGAVLAALIATGATKVYKSYLSKAARSCRKGGATERKTCMKQYRLQNKKQLIQLLQKGKETCRFSKDPAKCTYKIDKKINKIKLAMGTLHKE